MTSDIEVGRFEKSFVYNVVGQVKLLPAMSSYFHTSHEQLGQDTTSQNG